MTSRPSQLPTDAPRASVADEAETAPPSVAEFVHVLGGATLCVDVAGLADSSRPLRSNDGLESIWSEIRRTIDVFPSPRHGRRAEFRTGIARRKLEEHANELRQEAEVDLVLDRTLVGRVAGISTAEGAQHPTSLRTGWSAPRRSDGRASTDWPTTRSTCLGVVGILILVAAFVALLFDALVVHAGLATSALLPLGRARVIDRSRRSRNRSLFGSEWIKVGRGWLETGSGRRRFASRAITMILRESCDSESIEVRIVSDARVVRLRFESVDDPRFRAFWIRWGARRIESASRRAA